MKSLMFRFICCILLSSLLYSCILSEKEEPTPNPPVSDNPLPTTPWGKHDNFQEGLYNSRVFNNKLTVIGRSLIYPSFTIGSSVDPQSFEAFMSRPGRYKLPISSEVFATRTERDIRFFPKQSITSQNSIQLNVLDLDPDFMAFEDIPYWQGEAFGSTKNGVFIFPYRTINDQNLADNNPKFFLIKTEMEGSNVVIKNKKIIQPTNFNWFASVSRIDSFEKIFVLRSGNLTFAISEEGDVTQVNSIPSKAVQLENSVAVVGTDRSKNEISIYSSSDGGISWTLSVTQKIDDSLILNAEFAGVDGEILAYTGNRIFHLVRNSSNIQIVELENAGLQNGVISSIVKLDNESVFVTSLCDNNNSNCGGFHKTIDTFFNPKPSKE
jgi:hypothetical protein